MRLGWKILLPLSLGFLIFYIGIFFFNKEDYPWLFKHRIIDYVPIFVVPTVYSKALNKYWQYRKKYYRL